MLCVRPAFNCFLERTGLFLKDRETFSGKFKLIPAVLLRVLSCEKECRGSSRKGRECCSFIIALHAGKGLFLKVEGVDAERFQAEVLLYFKRLLSLWSLGATHDITITTYDVVALGASSVVGLVT